MRDDIAAKYVRENFAPKDRLAVVLVEKRTGAVIQRLATAEKVASEDFQSWLRHKNADRSEVYVSMNALHETRGAGRKPMSQLFGTCTWTLTITAQPRSKNCSLARICRSRTT